MNKKERIYYNSDYMKKKKFALSNNNLSLIINKQKYLH